MQKAAKKLFLHNENQRKGEKWMKLIDELFEMYRNKMTADEEDIDMLAFAVLEQFNHRDLVALISEMSEQEIKNLMGLYIIETLKGKFAQEGLSHHKHQTYHQRNVH